MDPIVSLAEKGNYALGAELVRLKLAEQSQIDSVRLAFDEHLMDGNIKRASILKILTWDMEGVEEKVILDYQIEEFNLGFCSLLSFQIEREALPEFTLKECWATMSVPFDSLSGMFFVSTASYLSREVRKHWEKRLTPQHRLVSVGSILINPNPREHGKRGRKEACRWGEVGGRSAR